MVIEGRLMEVGVREVERERIREKRARHKKT